MKELRAPAIYMASFEAWSKKTAYKELFKTMSKKILGIAKTAFAEMTSITPMAWAMWWTMEHNRFIREGYSQRELLTLHECMHQFLSAHSRGGLKRGKETAQASGAEASIDRL